MEILSEFELWLFLAGLGIFLFAMHMMEESIRVLSGAAFKSLIRRFTSTRPRAITSGILSTAVLQSSSAVSLMVLAFVGAGIMNLVQAISVMMGTKVGTTATAWIVAVFGFEFNIDSFSLPLIGIGGLGMILLARSPKYVNISKLLVAFGFLFMGLDYMKSSVDQFSEYIDPAMFADYGILVFALTGMILTAVMQSSSATIAIVLTMLFSGVIDFEAGAAMVVGANVGTTVTVLLGSIGGIHTKKQAAVSQLVFTVGTAILTLIILPVLVWFVLQTLGFSGNLVLGLAMFHTLFNVLGVIIFFPMIPLLVNNVEKWIPEKIIELGSYIYKTSPEISEAGIEAFRKEIISQLLHTLKFMRQIVSPVPKSDMIEYSDLEKYHAEIFEYYTKIHAHEPDEHQVEVMEELLRASRNVMNAAKNLHELKAEISVLQREPDSIHVNAFNSVKERLIHLGDLSENIGRVKQDGAQDEISAELETVFADFEKQDKDFIRMCSAAVSEPGFKKAEITFLLMVNRTVTQSARMIIFAIRSVIKHQPESN